MEIAANAAEKLGRDPELITAWREIAAGFNQDMRTNRRGLLAALEARTGRRIEFQDEARKSGKG